MSEVTDTHYGPGGQQIVSPQGEVLVAVPLAHFERLSAVAESFTLDPALNDPGNNAQVEVRSAIGEVESPLVETAGAGASNQQVWRLLAAALDVPG